MYRIIIITKREVLFDVFSNDQSLNTRCSSSDRRSAFTGSSSSRGANIDAVETAGRFGIDADRAVCYGTELNFRVMSETVASFRSCGAVPAARLDETRQDQKKRGGRRYISTKEKSELRVQPRFALGLYTIMSNFSEPSNR